MQALMKFFKELYDQGDEDTRRAMVKSMQESGGRQTAASWGSRGHMRLRLSCSGIIALNLVPPPMLLGKLPASGSLHSLHEAYRCASSCCHAGGTALSMNWGEVGKKDYSKKGKGGDDDDDEDWRGKRSSR
jgi:hypothetical protein